MKIKLRKTDKLFTKIVRILYNYTCQRCGRIYSPDRSLYNLGVSHFKGRSRESTRFELDNVTLLCNMPCHRRWETEDRREYDEYMLNRLGQKRFEFLLIQANTYQKRDDKLMELYLEQELKRLGGY